VPRRVRHARASRAGSFGTALDTHPAKRSTHLPVRDASEASMGLALFAHEVPAVGSTDSPVVPDRLYVSDPRRAPLRVARPGRAFLRSPVISPRHATGCRGLAGGIDLQLLYWHKL